MGPVSVIWCKKTHFNLKYMRQGTESEKSKGPALVKNGVSYIGPR